MESLITKILTNDTYVRRSTLSVTDINRGVKEIILAERYDDEIKSYIKTNKLAMQGKIFSIMGKAWDSMITHLCSKDPEYMVHTTLTMPFSLGGKEYTISGEIDLFHLPSKTLIDNKLVSTSKYADLVTISNREYTNQLNGYVWLLKEGYQIIDENTRALTPFDQDTSAIELTVGLRDWSRFSGRWDAINTLPCEMVNIELTRNAYIRKLIEYIKYKDVPDDEIPECSPGERWERPTTYPVFKKGKVDPRPMPRTAKFKTIQEANDYIAQHKDKDQLYAGHRPGGSKKCELCLVGNLGKCNFYNKIFNQL